MYRNDQYLDTLTYYHNHSSSKCYPTEADSITLTAAATGAWDVGTITEIVPASTIDKDFDIHYVNISEISASDEFELIVYTGASGSEEEWARIRFTRSTALAQEGDRVIQGPPIPANTRVSMALACKGGTAKTCNVSIHYHDYPDGLIY